MHSHFKLKDLGTLKCFLGLELAHSSKGIVLSQQHYTLQLLEDTCYLGCKPTIVHMDPRLQLDSFTETILAVASSYRQLGGRLLYLTLSRPYITFSIHKLSQFVSQPREPHLKAAHHLLRYLKRSPG